MPYFLGTLSPRHPPLFPPRLSLAELAKAIRSSCASESQGLGTTAATSISHGASWTYPYAAARLRMMHPTWTATGLVSSCVAREGEIESARAAPEREQCSIFLLNLIC